MNALSVHLLDDVARAQPGLRSRARLDDVADQRAAAGFGTEAARKLGRELLEAHADPSPCHLSARPQLARDVAGEVCRDREADASTRVSDDHRVYAEHLALEVNQRAS